VDLEATTAVPVALVDLLLVAVTSAAVAPAGPVVGRVVLTSADLADLAVLAAPVDLVTSVDLAVRVALVDLVTSVGLAVPVAQVTSVGLTVRAALAAQVTSVVPGVRVTSTEAAPATSDRGLMTPSAASAANRGAMEPRLGAGALHPGQAGAARSLHLEGSGTRAR
jgi:hypothetical protein